MNNTMNIEFISAGAGSGKTYKLTQTLAQALADGSARPHAVLATTFTVKAATELRERARAWLLEQGRVDLATAIGQARLGTVNSVCGQMLQRFCFELGLSPDQTVLGEGQAKRLLTATLGETLDAEGQQELLHLTHRLGIEQEDWANTLKAVVDAALANDITPAALRPMGLRNAELMLAYWPQPTAADTDPTATLTDALGDALQAVSKMVEAQKAAGAAVAQNLQNGLGDLQRLERAFREGHWSWPDWLAAAGLEAGAKAKHLLESVKEAAQAHDSHPQFHADVRQYLQRVFEIAAEGLGAYADAKKALGAVDFSDQEVLLLRAIRHNASVRQALAAELDLVMVDEFQDTSPLQLALFIELAQLAKRSIWVGDPKQAIYGFRGTDARLIAGVLQAIPAWGGTVGQALTQSRRSTPAQVGLSNAVFGHAFAPELSPQQVCLSATRQDIAGQPALLNWQFDSSKKETDYLGLGQAVRELLASGLQVPDRHSGELRALQPGDIGMLCRFNDEVNLAVASLTHWGVASASPRAGLLGTAEALFVLACLRRLHDPSDTVATALVLSLADGTPVEQWLPDRLAHLAQDGAQAHAWKTQGNAAHPLLARLEALRPLLAALTPREALRLAAAESQVAWHAAQWSSTPHQAHHRLANVEALLTLAQGFEDECAAAKRPATVGGLLRWLAEVAEAGDDERAATADNAVSVLTYHRAKGLEWPVVVLSSLGATARSALWSVRARTDGDFDPTQPLGQRFVHCWVPTWGKRKKPQAAVDAEASPLGLAMQSDALAENKRLLYVGLTRARDLNALLTFARKSGPACGWVEEIPGASQILFAGSDSHYQLPGGQPCPRMAKTWSAEDCALRNATPATEARYGFKPRPRTEAAPLWFNPSSTEGPEGSTPFSVTETTPVGVRIALAGQPDMAALGTALHLCIARAAALGRLEPAEVAHILRQWGVANAVTQAAVEAQLKAFSDWCQQRWPGCPRLVEVPLEANRPDGTRMRSRIDMLIQTPQGWVLIDHKSNPGGSARDDALAQEHGPQLAAYAQALHAATGLPVLEQWLYLPVGARLLRLQST